MYRTLDLYKQGFQSSSGVTDEWKKFVYAMRGEMLSEVRSVNGTNFRLHRGHFYVHGFFQVEGQWYYISITDVRHFRHPIMTMLIRTAKSNKDYTGGTNEYMIVKSGMLRKYFGDKKMNEILNK